MDFARWCTLLLTLLVVLALGTACSSDVPGAGMETPDDVGETQQSDVGDVSDAGDSPDAGDASDAGSSTDQDVQEPEGDAVDPDVQADPSQWEDEFDLGEEELDEEADLIIGGPERPARVLWPEDYDGTEELPVVFLFHGFTATSGLQDAYFNMSPQRHDREFILVLPDGHRDATGQQYWNATDFCCDHYGENPDDVGYFVELLDELLEEVAADPDRVHLMGHSNGHFFSNRLACELGSRIASVVGFAGGGHWDEADCPRDGAVSMLHIHGTNDALVYYTGALGLYPGARTMTDRWSERNDCSGSSSIYGYVSLASLIWGNETVQRSYGGCPQDIDVELWTITGGSHTPLFESDFADRILDFSLPKTNPDGP